MKSIQVPKKVTFGWARWEARQCPRTVLLPLMLSIVLSGCAQQVAGQIEKSGENVAGPAEHNCPVVFAPASSFLPPAPFAETPGAGQMWYGSPALWTVLPQNGIWEALPQSDNGYGQKLFWWSEEYSPDTKPPVFEVTGKKFGEPETTANTLGAENGSQNGLGAFLVNGIEFPAAGCWEITGSYRGHSLSYVVWVEGADGK